MSTYRVSVEEFKRLQERRIGDDNRKPTKPTPTRITTSLYPLVQLCIFGGLPAPVPEFVWHPQRRYRADYAFVQAKILIEIDGGLFVNGGHSRGQARIHDMAKDRAATKLGWRTLRYPQSSDVWAEIIADLRDMLP